jgi:hypothetical protein
MLDLAFYIRNLLYNHEVVIIPGLGALLTKYKPAEINASDNSVTPPSKYIAFSCTLTITDGVLANYIASQKKISIQEAELYIEREVALINKKLDAEETILLDGIGYLSKKDGIIRFEKEQDANFFTDTFGLSKVDYKNVNFKPTLKHEELIEFPIKRRSKAWIYVLLVFIIFGGGITYLYFSYPGLIDRAVAIFRHPSGQNQSATNKDTIKYRPKDSNRADSLEKFFDSATDKKKALAIRQAKPMSNEGKTAQGTTYYIIAGSFNTFDRAAKFSKQLDKQGIKSEVIQFNQDTFRVSLGEFDDKGKALVELAKIRKIKGNESAWLLNKINE